MLWQLFHFHFAFGLNEALIFTFLIFPGILLGKLCRNRKKQFTIIFIAIVLILELLTYSHKIAWKLFQYEHWILARLNFLGYIAECIMIPLTVGMLLSWILPKIIKLHKEK